MRFHGHVNSDGDPVRGRRDESSVPSVTSSFVTWPSGEGSSDISVTGSAIWSKRDEAECELLLVFRQGICHFDKIYKYDITGVIVEHPRRESPCHPINGTIVRK